jgi:tRNA pseudouridine55 synthase
MSRRRGPVGPAEVLLVDKPDGPTSHDCVAAVRRVLGGRAGHAGTLDPFATGLLVVLRGPATRLAPYLLGLDKGYDVIARLGATTATGDRTAEVVATGAAPVSAEAVAAALPALTGAIVQRVPAHSAVQVRGRRLYQLAHRGQALAEEELPTREVRVVRFALLDFDAEAQRARLAVECSSGTYVRRLVTDLGDLVGAGGYCEELRRTRVGPLAVTDARPLADLPDRASVDPLDAVGHLPLVPVEEAEAEALAHGRPVASAAADGPVRVVAPTGFAGVGEAAAGRLRLRVRLA